MVGGGTAQHSHSRVSELLTLVFTSRTLTASAGSSLEMDGGTEGTKYGQEGPPGCSPQQEGDWLCDVELHGTSVHDRKSGVPGVTLGLLRRSQVSNTDKKYSVGGENGHGRQRPNFYSSC